jgi:hypothetical protein
MRLPDISLSRRTWLTYAACVAILVAVKLFFLVVPATFPGADQATAFSWPLVIGVSVFGAIGLILSPYARIPDPWDPSVSDYQRFGLPVLDGFAYGLITVLRDLSRPSDVHLAFPASIPFYLFGGVFLEILLRLFGLTVLTLLLWKLLLRGRAYGAAFWTANVLVALYEPLPFIKEELAHSAHLAGPGILVDWALQPLFLANVLTGYLYRRYGFLNAVTLRVAFYAVWHVAYGGFRPYWLSF